MKKPQSRYLTSLMLLSLSLTATTFWISFLKTGHLNLSLSAVAATLVFLYGVFLLVASLSNIIITVFILFHFFSLLSLISAVKFAKRRIPLIFNDLLLADELGKFNDVVRIEEFLWPMAAALLVTLLALMTVIRWRRNLVVDKRSLSLLLGISLVLGSAAYATTHPRDFHAAGPVYAFLASINLPEDRELSPEERRFIELMQDRPPEATSPKDRPNVILIMSESFWDLTLLPGVTMTPDPYESFEAIRRQSLYGMLEVPVFAGGTSNTEFEILTSISTHIHPEGHMVFNRDIQGPTASLASIFRQQGYQSLGLHPFWGWYYNRNQVYADLGFNAFISEEYLNEPKYVGHYISDATTLDHVQTLIDETPDPLFLYTITMQNHGPFDDGRYGEDGLQIRVEAEADSLIMENYAQGMADAIGSLERLLETLTHHEEKTLVVFFGDHLPLLGDNLSSLEGNGLFGRVEDPALRELKLKTTPLIIWSNYGTPTGDMGILDAIYLGPKVLQLAGLEMPAYYGYLLDLSREVSLINPDFTLKGDTLLPSDSETYAEVHFPLKALYKDLILGEGVSLENRWLLESQEAFNRSLKTMNIDEIHFSSDEVTLHGGPFYEKARLYLNGKAIPFQWHEDHLAVDPGFFPEEESFTLYLELTDNRGGILSRSETLTIK